MGAIKSAYFDLINPGIPARSVPSPLPSAASPKHLFVLTMNGQPLSVYANESTALRDLTVMREGDERDGYDNVYFVKEMRVDYT